MIVNRLTANAELAALMGRYRGALAPVVALSVALNVLALTGSIYLMLVYDRVLLSGSLATLASIFAIVIMLYAFQGGFDTLRARLLQMVGQGFDSEIAPRLQRLESALQVATPGAQANPLRDLDQVRNFLGSPGPGAIIDLPWIVFFLLVLLLIHPALALTTLAGAMVLGFVTLQNDRRMRAAVKEAGTLAAEHHAAAEGVRRNAGAIRGLGIGERMDDLVIERRHALVASQARLARLTARYSALSKGLRMLVQSGVLTTGAVLVIDHTASAGVIFASSAGASLPARPILPGRLPGTLVFSRGILLTLSSFSVSPAPWPSLSWRQPSALPRPWASQQPSVWRRSWSPCPRRRPSSPWPCPSRPAPFRPWP